MKMHIIDYVFGNAFLESPEFSRILPSKTSKSQIEVLSNVLIPAPPQIGSKLMANLEQNFSSLQLRKGEFDFLFEINVNQ